MVIYNNKSETQQVAPGTLAHPTKCQGVHNGLSTYLYWNLHIPHQKSVKKWHINDIIDSHTLREIPCDSDELKVCTWWQYFFLHFLKLQSLICIQKWEISLLTISQFDCFTLQA